MLKAFQLILSFENENVSSVFDFSWNEAKSDLQKANYLMQFY